MSFKIDAYLDATNDKYLKKEIICIHDNLYTAYKILESVKDAAKLKESPSEEVLIAIFHELQQRLDSSD
jgi:hypothetical protein